MILHDDFSSLFISRREETWIIHSTRKGLFRLAINEICQSDETQINWATRRPAPKNGKWAVNARSKLQMEKKRKLLN